jgi:predicted dehydrogenase
VAEVRLGLIGAGRWGRRYIQTLNEMPGVTLSRLASSNPESASLLPPDCTITQDWKAVAADQALDGIIIATPPALHAPMAEVSIRAGIPVLVEKPMTLSLAEARRLVDLAETTSCLVFVGHTHLFSSAFRALKQSALGLGELRHIRSHGGNWGPYRPATPMLWDWAPHDIAMCLNLVGADPIEVHASRTSLSALPDGEGEAIELKLDFPNGVRADIRVSNIDQKKNRYFEAQFAKGTLIYDDLSTDKLCIHMSSEEGLTPIPLDSSMSLSNLVTEFCNYISAGRDTHESLGLGLRVIEVLHRSQQEIGPRADIPSTPPFRTIAK